MPAKRLLPLADDAADRLYGTGLQRSHLDHVTRLGRNHDLAVADVDGNVAAVNDDPAGSDAAGEHEVAWAQFFDGNGDAGGDLLRCGGMIRRIAGNLPAAVAGMVVTSAVVGRLLALTDALSDAVLVNTDNQSLHFLSGFGKTITTGPGGFAAVVLGLLAVVGGLLLWIELIVRASLVYVLVAISPLGFAATLWPSAKGILRKSIELLLAVILSKLVICITLAIGVAALSGAGTAGPAGAGFASGAGASLGALLVGTVLLGIAAFSPFIVLKLVPVAEAAVVAQGISRGPLRAGQSGMSTAYSASTLSRLAGGGPGGGAPGAPGGPGPAGGSGAAGSAGSPSAAGGAGAGGAASGGAAAGGGGAAAGGAAATGLQLRQVLPALPSRQVPPSSPAPPKRRGRWPTPRLPPRTTRRARVLRPTRPDRKGDTMTDSSPTSERPYRFAPLDRTGLLLGLSGVQCALVGAGIFISGGLLQSGVHLGLTIVPLVVGAVLAFGAWEGRHFTSSSHSWAVTGLRVPSGATGGEQPFRSSRAPRPTAPNSRRCRPSWRVSSCSTPVRPPGHLPPLGPG